MKMKLAVALLPLLLVAGCAQPPAPAPSRPPITIRSPFDAAAARLALQPGPNTITRNAFMRQQGGGVVTCAGSVVNLIPATAYALDRFFVLYGSRDSGTNRGSNTTFSPDVPEYHTTLRSTKCDAQGNFTFEAVADGDFLIQTQVGWIVAGRIQGGNIFQRIRVSGGRVERVILSS